MKTPLDLLTYAKKLEEQLSELYSFMVERSGSKNCQLLESLKLLLEENNIQVNIISLTSYNYNHLSVISDTSGIIEKEHLATDLKSQINDAKDAFRMAINLERKILEIYQNLRVEVEAEDVDLLLRTLIRTKEDHIKVLNKYMSSDIINKICEEKAKTPRATSSITFSPRPSPTN